MLRTFLPLIYTWPHQALTYARHQLFVNQIHILYARILLYLGAFLSWEIF